MVTATSQQGLMVRDIVTSGKRGKFLSSISKHPIMWGQVWYLIVLIPDLCTLTYSRDTRWGHVKFFIDQWKLIKDDNLVLSTIAKGYKLEFQSFPPFSGISETVVDANNQAILNSIIESLRQKAVIEPVPLALRL